MTDERYPDVEGRADLIEMARALHAHLPEDQRPVARMDFSDDQWARLEAAAAVISAPLQARLSKAEGERVDFARYWEAIQQFGHKTGCLAGGNILEWLETCADRLSEAAALRVERDEAAAKYKHWHDVAMRAGVVVCTDGSLIYAVAESKAALRERVGELEKGLEPFARVDRDLPQEQPDDLTCAIHTSITSMGGAYAQRGDFRRAAQLLKDNPNPENDR